MRNNLLIKIVQDFVAEAIEAATPAKRFAIATSGNLVLGALDHVYPPHTRPKAGTDQDKRGDRKRYITISVGQHGHIHALGLAAAAKLLWSKPNSVNVRLSNGGGTYKLTKTDPVYGGRMDIFISRGQSHAHDEKCVKLLDLAMRGKRATLEPGKNLLYGIRGPAEEE